MRPLAGVIVASLLRMVASLDNGLPLSSAGAIISDTTLLPEETIQLTESALAQSVYELSRQFGNRNIPTVFHFASNASSKRATSRCKTYADDSLWPTEWVWQIFDVLLGGALLEVPPIASPCYTNWGNYDAATCQSISDGFTNSNLHAEHPSSIMSPFYQVSLTSNLAPKQIFAKINCPRAPHACLSTVYSQTALSAATLITLSMRPT